MTGSCAQHLGALLGVAAGEVARTDLSAKEDHAALHPDRGARGRGRRVSVRPGNPSQVISRYASHAEHSRAAEDDACPPGVKGRGAGT